jgi:hypothetical protein
MLLGLLVAISIDNFWEISMQTEAFLGLAKSCV